MTLERQYEQMLVNFPNLLDPNLDFMKKGKLGDTNAYLRQAVHREGRIDLAFVTDTLVHLVELKRDVIAEDCLKQWLSYYEFIRAYYPNHDFYGYLVGGRCLCVERLKEMIGAHPVRILLYWQDLPHWSQVRGCPRCGFGLTYDLPCPRCAGSVIR